MYADTERLSRKAHELFGNDEALVDELNRAMNEEAFSEMVEKSRSEGQKGGMQIQSVRTLYLADWFYSEKLVKGVLTGNFSLRWDGLNDSGKARFVYLPDENNPLTYSPITGSPITPERMFTDGGSIPRLLHPLRKFSPWYYAPAFMIHDWLFHAKHCNHERDGKWEFKDSARIMAEVMKCLMEDGFPRHSSRGEGGLEKLKKDEDVLFLMYLAVGSSFAKRAWNSPSGYVCSME